MEFRRFVSYVYAYREDVKQQNCGFVRVEIRQDTVRFWVHMSLPEKRGTEYKVYGFVREEGRIEGVFLGSGSIRHGNVDVRIQMNAKKLGMEEDIDEQQAVCVDDLCGMVVLSSDFCRYGTVWDDGDLTISDFQERRSRRDDKADDGQREFHVKESLDGEEAHGAKEQDSKAVTESMREPEDAGELEGMEEPDSHEEMGDVRTDEWDGKDHERKATSSIKDENGNAGTDEMQLEYADWWEKLKNICSEVAPFSDELDGDYIRIEPKELKYLPPQLWYLGRNSFLLHGYYSYRYLILGKVDDGFILGIPGVYFPMEEGIATMFGFGRFLVAKDQNQRGRFGFWCRKIL